MKVVTLKSNSNFIFTQKCPCPVCILFCSVFSACNLTTNKEKDFSLVYTAPTRTNSCFIQGHWIYIHDLWSPGPSISLKKAYLLWERRISFPRIGF